MTWTLNAGAVGADLDTGISARPIPEEPMVRLCASPPCPTPFSSLTFPASSFPKLKLTDG